MRILIFSMHTSATFARSALRAGAAGYVTKTNEPAILIEAVRAVHQGKTFVSPDIAQAVARENLTGENDPMRLLTPREFEIFRKLAAGASVRDIAGVLNLSQKQSPTALR